MIKHQDGIIVIHCDNFDCDAQDQFDHVKDMSLFKELVRENGWHIRKHSKCFCMDCWNEGKR